MHASPSKSSLFGKRYRNLLRVSTLLNDASTDDQRLVNTKFAKTHGMIHVGGDEVLEGVSGSKTFNRHDLKRLLTKATLKKDYDVLLVYDSSRLTRGGAGHGYSIRRQFAKAGVLIQSVMDDVPDGDLKDVMQSIIDTQNALYSKRLSGNSTRGIVSAVLRGDVAHHGALPIGIDRIYVRADGVRFLRLRYAGNCVRELYNEETGKLLLRREHGTGTTYRKQKSEKVIMVPGDERTVEAIRDAFEKRYIRGWGYAAIGRELTRRGVTPLLGTMWTACSVRSFILNPLYLGWEYFLKTAAGLFYKGSVDGPIIREDVHQEKLEDQGMKSLPKLFRERSEMLHREQPEMNQFLLDPNVREKASLAISRYFDNFHVRGKPPEKGKQPAHLINAGIKRFPSTLYFLRGIMREPNYHVDFAGRAQGGTADGDSVRYYHLSHSQNFCEKGSPGRRTIPAEAIESVVIEIVQHVFQRTRQIAALVNGFVKKVLAEKRYNPDRDCLVEELRETTDRLRLIYTTATAKKLAEMRDLLRSLQLREDQINYELSLMPVDSIKDDAQTIGVRVIETLSRLTKNLDESGREKLRCLLRALITDFTVDLNTREGRLVIALPEDLLRSGSVDFSEMCAAYSEGHSPKGRTHNFDSLKIGVFRLIPPVHIGERWPQGASYTWVEEKTPKTKSDAA